MTHIRRGPVEHRFRYDVGFVLIDLDEADELVRRSWWLSSAKWAAASFLPLDHDVDGRTAASAQELAALVRDRVGASGGVAPTGAVRLLCQLRRFGVYFSPLNLFFCFDGSGGDERLAAVVAEVSNTPWDERRLYVLDWFSAAGGREDDGTRRVQRFVHAKDFHVSPFMEMGRRYEWRLTAPGERLHVRIRSCGEGSPPFEATMTLRRTPWSDWALVAQLARFPWAGVQILAAIYWQAFQLWRKKCPYYPHPGRARAAR